jgi:uncharacterized protein involved in tolerance to divalent cations
VISLILLITGVLATPLLQAQEPTPQEETIASITRIVRHVAAGIREPGQEALSAEQENLVAKISAELIQEAALVEAEQAYLSSKHQERDALIKKVVVNGAKGIAIVIALLVLRAIIGAIGRGSSVESPHTPIGVLITMPSADQALALGKSIIDRELATGGSVTPTLQSLYRQDDKAYATPEAMLMLRTTNEHLRAILSQAETSSTTFPEIIALSRSLLPT